MDAKPQRPLRSFKVRDENLPPNMFPGKTIHQRNKSSPALSTLAQPSGASRLGVKRTAFADVSNTNRGNQTVKDDSVLTSTKTALESLKEVSEQENGRPAPFLRPAQRPLSVSGIKGFLNNFTSNASAVVPKQNPLQPQPEDASQLANTRKVRTKKSTAVFKEIASNTTTLPEGGGLSDQIKDAADPKIREAENVKQLYPEPYPHTHQYIKSSTSYASHQQLYDHQLPPLPESSDSHDIRSDGARLHSSHGLPLALPEYAFAGSEIYEDASSHFVPEPEPVRPVEKSVASLIPESDADVARLLAVSEFDEYWEAETYEERYEEEGYTTARSLKSRGDYTTGPTTVVLAPKMTAKVERELAAAKQFVQETRAADEIEEDESWDTSMVAEYGDEIFDYMRSLEERMRPNPYYMDNQTEVQWSMRSVLMDWLVQVHHRFSLLPETLFLCVNYIDRFLSSKVVSLGKLQLVGATAIFVAAKYEEINCPSVSEIQYMVDGGYTVDEILKAERFMLSMLQFELGWPGPMSFLRRISKADDYDLETRTLAKYFLEVTIMDERFVGCIPSFTAAGAHCLARLMLKKGSWTPAHVYYSNYTYSQLRPLLNAMLSCCEDPQKHHAAVFDKYGDKRFKRASFFVQNEMQKGFVLPSAPSTSISVPGHDKSGRNVATVEGLKFA